MKLFTIVINIFSLLLGMIFIVSCGCECDCTKGKECIEATVKIIGSDSVLFIKEYCQSYSISDKFIDDSLKELLKSYPDDKYSIAYKDTLIVYDKFTTKKCRDLPSDYSCICAH